VQKAASLNLRYDYDAGLLSERSLRAISSHFARLLSELSVSGSRPLGKVGMLTEGERERLSLGSITTARGHAAAAGAALAADLGCLHQRIEARAVQQPSAVAVTWGREQLTYGELNERANRLAWGLRQAQVGPDVFVGLCLERSLDLIVGILAVLKAGGAYVPIDPRYPEERIAYLIEDSGIRLLLTHSEVLAGMPPLSVPAWCLDRPESAAWPADNLPNLTHPDHLAYCIYTSGSTGKPKGALITHRNVMRLFDTSDDSFHFDAGDVWTLFHSAAFDFSVWELFGALSYGGRLVIVPYYVSRSPGELLELLVAERVTVLNQTPSAFKQLMALPELEAPDLQLALRYVIFGGEALDARALAPWFARFGDQRPVLVNMYGITETTVHVTYRPLTVRDAEQHRGGIGHALGDLTCFTLDRALDLAPAGVLGELHVGGAGLARGYHRRPGLTAERFIPNPFAQHPGERLYRSGDLGRRRPDADGELEYSGRIDHQVKIRGYRIELGEIESALRRHSAVRDALVLARRGAQGPELVGYAVVSGEARAPIGVSLRQHLEGCLPEYMVPAHLVVLDQMPLTENGKLDRRALPEPGASAERSRFVAPVSEIEQRIASIWQEVLGVERVGRSHDFFELGGHSLLATRVIAHLRHDLQLSVPLSDLFEARCLEQFAARVEQRRSGSEQPQVLSQLEALLDEVDPS
jgi:amino acid adenylation domain-containing protein